jgi:catechol 2,3-dioxygenase-like lactoylglutathione lyase family enzyme
MSLPPFGGARSITGVTVQRMDHVGIVVEDLAAAVTFFVALGLSVQGEGLVEGEWAERIVGLAGLRAQIALLGTADGRPALELSQFLYPAVLCGDDRAPANVTGLRHLSFAVDDLDGVLDRVRACGGELIGEVGEYEDVYRLCYVRGPAGVIVELAERLG